MTPKVLTCESCEISMEGPFRFNEFATLSPEDLHFLRIFIQCEGRVRDMEPALGLSYPTIRSRLTDLKNRLVGAAGTESPVKAKSEKKETAQEVLAKLEAGDLSFEEAMDQIKKIKNTKSGYDNSAGDES